MYTLFFSHIRADIPQHFRSSCSVHAPTSCIACFCLKMWSSFSRSYFGVMGHDTEYLHTPHTHIIQQVYRWLTRILCNLLLVQLVRKKLLLNPSFYKKERIFAHIHTNAIKLTTITSFGDIILLQLVERLACVHMTITLLASCNSILHYLVFIDINASNWRMAIPQLYSFTVNLIMCAHQIIFFLLIFFLSRLLSLLSLIFY